MSARITTHRAILVALATLAVLAGGLALMASPGLGFGGYRTLPSVEFGTTGSGNGQFSGAKGIAVDDSTGDVYVVDQGNNRVEKFDANGNYISQFTGVETPAKSFSGPYSVAVNNSCALHNLTGKECMETFPSTGDVYVTDNGHAVVDAFDSNGKYLSQITGPSPSTPFTPERLAGVAVDPEGNLWVAELTKVLRFNSSGEFQSSLEAGGETALNGLAVDSEDDVYTVEYSASVNKFSVTGKVLAGGLAHGFTIAVNLLTNNVIVGSNQHNIEFGPFAEPYGAVIQEFGSGGGGNGYGYSLGLNDVTQTAYSSRENTVSIYPEAIPAKVLSSQVTEPRRSSAVVLGDIGPEGSSMRYRVDYGETSKYGQHSLEFEVAASDSAQAVQLGLEGLAPGRVYHYALQVSNTAGTTVGPDGTFTTTATTPPTAVTGGASNVTLTTATVSGTIDPEGLETSYEFDLGTDTSYGTSIYGEAGSASEPTELSIPLQNLAPGSTYHYRIVSINSDGKTYGADQTFTTPAYSAPIVLPFALPLLQTPAIVFPTATGTIVGGVTHKSLTNAQKLANALKACRKKAKRRQAVCEKRARKRYPSAKRPKR
jgi:hypothetical protein